MKDNKRKMASVVSVFLITVLETLITVLVINYVIAVPFLMAAIVGEGLDLI